LSGQLDILVPTLLLASSKSFSHLGVFADRYQGVLQALVGQDQKMQSMVVEGIGQFWSNSKGHVPIVFSKLMSLECLNMQAIVAWCFSQPTLFHEPFVWCVLNTCTIKQLKTFEQQAAQVPAPDVLESITSISDKRLAMFSTIFNQFAIALTNSNDMSTQKSSLEARCRQFARMFAADLAPHMTALEDACISDDADVALTRVFDLLNALMPDYSATIE
jgi:hypothetical protein